GGRGAGRGGEAGAAAAGDPPAAGDPAAAGEAGGGRGGGGGGGGGQNAATSFGIVTLAGASSTVNGVAPSLSRDGRFVSWIVRAGAATAGGDQRLLVAPADNTATPVELHKGSDRLDAPSLAPDGSRVVFQMMTADDWELFVVNRDGKGERRVTREIQHDVLPQFLGSDRLLAMMGEPRHRRSYVYELEATPGPVPAMKRMRVFHNNTVRTIAPEYVWVPSADGSKLLIVAERDGDTVSPERGVYLVDLATKVTAPDVIARIDASLKAERTLRDNGKRMFGPIAADVAKITA